MPITIEYDAPEEITRSRIILGEPDSNDWMQFIRLSGQPEADGTLAEPFVRPGVDGYGFQHVARRGEPFRLFAFRDFESMGEAVAAGKALKDILQGQLCTICDSSGVVHERMVCLNVRAREPRPVALMVGGLTANPGALIEIDFDFVYAGPAADEEEGGDDE